MCYFPSHNQRAVCGGGGVFNLLTSPTMPSSAQWRLITHQVFADGGGERKGLKGNQKGYFTRLREGGHIQDSPGPDRGQAMRSSKQTAPKSSSPSKGDKVSLPSVQQGEEEKGLHLKLMTSPECSK